VFASGYVSSQTGIATIAKLLPDCLILLDARNHNSMIEGIRQSGVERQIWRHNDVDHLETLLRAAAGRPKLIAYESLYSMDGGVAPIRRICELAELCINQ
jgi:5-aminolevulinate synthase